jgi:flagellar biosynthesis component FlhA
MNIDTLLGMKLSDLASIVFGIIAVILGLASYRRAKLSEKLSIESDERAKRAEDRSNANETRAHELTFAQHKSAALDLVTEGEVVRIAAGRRLRSLRDAAIEAGATEVVGPVDQNIAGCEKSVSLIRNLRAEVESVTIAGISHEELVEMIDKVLAKEPGTVPFPYNE